MRRLVLLLMTFTLICAAVAPATAADKPAAKTPAKKGKAVTAQPGPFDGLYSGVLTPAPALSKNPCGAVTIADFEIDRGKVVVLPGVVAFEGTVTPTGFLSGAMRRFDDPKVSIQGRAAKEADVVHIRGGIIDINSGCAWTMDLKARPPTPPPETKPDPKAAKPKKR